MGTITDRALEPYERSAAQPHATGRMTTHHEAVPGISPAWALRVAAVFLFIVLPACALLWCCVEGTLALLRSMGIR